MRCEVLAIKDVRSFQVATVRLVDQPNTIGEVPVAKGMQVQRGDLMTIEVRPVVFNGRLQFTGVIGK